MYAEHAVLPITSSYPCILITTFIHSLDTLPAARQKTYLKVAQSDHSLAQDLLPLESGNYICRISNNFLCRSNNAEHRQHEYWTKILCSTDNNINGKDGFNTSARQAYLWVSKLRYARNRAAHLEPMLNSDDLREYHRIAIETLRALQPGSEEWVLAARKIPSAIQNKPSSYTHTLWAPNCSQYIS